MYNAKSDFDYNISLIVVMHKPGNKLLISELLREGNVSWSWDRDPGWELHVKCVTVSLDTRGVQFFIPFLQGDMYKGKEKRKNQCPWYRLTYQGDRSYRQNQRDLYIGTLYYKRSLRTVGETFLIDGTTTKCKITMSNYLF